MVYVSRGKSSDLLTLGGDVDSGKVVHKSFYEALVEDVIVDHFHPKYSSTDGYNVGDIKVRVFDIDNTLDSDKLSWASPFCLNHQQYPLIGEVVIVQFYFGKFYYTSPLNMTKRLQESGMLNLSNAINNRFRKLTSPLNNSNFRETKPDEPLLGAYYKPDSRVRQLKHFEGDYILQGRMGHSIRFGSSAMDVSSDTLAPNIIFRTGQGKDLEQTNATVSSDYGLILEDINKDASSIWMTADQAVKIVPATTNAGSYIRSVDYVVEYPFQGAQILLNSDRLILNSKKEETFLFSSKGIHLNSFNDATVDTDSNILLTANLDINFRCNDNIEMKADKDVIMSAGSDIFSTANEKISFVSDKLHIGSVSNTDEPLVGGTSLSIFLARLIMALIGMPKTIRSQTQANSRISIPRTIFPGLSANAHVFTSVGPGKLASYIITDLTKLYNELAAGAFAKAPFNSEDNFVMLQNEIPDIVLNEFEAGTNEVEEGSTWNYDESYYNIKA